MTWSALTQAEPRLLSIERAALRAHGVGSWHSLWAKLRAMLQALVGPGAEHPDLRSVETLAVARDRLAVAWAVGDRRDP